MLNFFCSVQYLTWLSQRQIQIPAPSPDYGIHNPVFFWQILFPKNQFRISGI